MCLLALADGGVGKGRQIVLHVIFVKGYVLNVVISGVTIRPPQLILT